MCISQNSPIEDLASDEETPQLTKERGLRRIGDRGFEDGSHSEPYIQKTGCCEQGSRAMKAYASQGDE